MALRPRLRSALIATVLLASAVVVTTVAEAGD